MDGAREAERREGEAGAWRGEEGWADARRGEEGPEPGREDGDEPRSWEPSRPSW
jgi:hypothetical protein